MTTTTQSRWLRVQQAADLLGVSASTVRRWADSGRLACQRTPSGQRRFLLDDLEAIVPRGSPSPCVRNVRPERRRAALPAAVRDQPRARLQPRARRGPAVGGATPERRPGDPRLRHLPARRTTSAWSAWPPALDGVFDASWVGQRVPPGRLALRPARRRDAARGHREQPRRPAAQRGRTRGDAPLRPAQLRLAAADRPRQGHRPGRPPRPRRARVHRRGDRHRRGGRPAGRPGARARPALRGGQEPPPGQPAGPQLGAFAPRTTTPSATPAGWPPTWPCSAASWAGRPSAWKRCENVAFLHDIGKIGVSDRVLLKAGPLTSEEWELIRQHPGISAEIVRPLFDEELVAGVRHHHERFDGKGYPDGLAGEEIPLARPGDVRRRLLRRHVLPAPLPAGPELPPVPGRAASAAPARSSTREMVDGLPCACCSACGGGGRASPSSPSRPPS